MQAYELNFDSTDFESFNDRKGRVATLPWKTTDEFFVIKTQQEMKEGKPKYQENDIFQKNVINNQQ